MYNKELYNTLLARWKSTFEKMHLTQLSQPGTTEPLVSVKRLDEEFNKALERESYELCQAITDAWYWYKTNREAEILKIPRNKGHNLSVAEPPRDAEEYRNEELFDEIIYAVENFLSGSTVRETLDMQLRNLLDDYEDGN